MYVPPAFAEHDAGVVHAFIDAHPLGALVTASPAHAREAGSAGLFATHLPLLLDRSRGPFGVLQGHVARANPHHAAREAADALVIFTGSEAYVTPSWYPSKQEHGRTVPTWNYVAVHAHGTLRFVEDEGWLLAHLEALTARHEQGRAHPWALTDAPAGYIERLARDVVGVEVEIARLDGKWKMSQNRSAADIGGVIAGLRAEDDTASRAVADEVEARMPDSKRDALPARRSTTDEH